MTNVCRIVRVVVPHAPVLKQQFHGGIKRGFGMMRFGAFYGLHVKCLL